MKNLACSHRILAWVAVVALLLPLGACASPLPDPLAGSLITSTAFSPDGMTIAAGYSQGQRCAVLIWDVHAPTTPPRILGCDTPEVDAVAFSPDGAFLAAASSDQAVLIWSTQAWERPPTVLTGLDSGRASVVYSPDGRWLAAGSGSRVLLWDRRQTAGAPPQVLSQAAPSPTLAFSSDSQLLAEGSGNGSVRSWRLDNPTADPLIARVPTPSKIIGATIFLEGEHIAAVGESRQTIELLDVGKSGETAGPLWAAMGTSEDDMLDVISALAQQHGTRVVGAASPAGGIDFWDTGQPDSKRTTLGEAGANAIAFSPDGTWLVAGSLSGTVSLWDTRYPDHQPVPLDVPSLVGTPPPTP